MLHALILSQRPAHIAVLYRRLLLYSSRSIEHASIVGQRPRRWQQLRAGRDVLESVSAASESDILLVEYSTSLFSIPWDLIHTSRSVFLGAHQKEI